MAMKKCILYTVQRRKSLGYVVDDFSTSIVSAISEDKAVDLVWKTYNTEVVTKEEFVAKPLTASSRNRIHYQFSAPRRINIKT